MSWLEGLVGLAGSLWGADESADAADDAAKAQVDAANRQRKLQEKMWKQSRKDQKPWLGMGKSSVGMLNRMMGFKGGLPATPTSGINDWGQYFDASKASQDRIPAMINTQEAALLKANGGAGVQNPQTGMWHFYDVNDPAQDTWSRNYEAMGNAAAKEWEKNKPSFDWGRAGRDVLMGGTLGGLKNVGGYFRDLAGWASNDPRAPHSKGYAGDFGHGYDNRSDPYYGGGYGGYGGGNYTSLGGPGYKPMSMKKFGNGYMITNQGTYSVNPPKPKSITKTPTTTAATAPKADPWAGYFMSDFGPSDLLKDPSYQFRMDEARRALEANAAAKGTLGSGGYIRDLNALTQNLASTEYGNAWNRWSGTMGDRFNRLAALSGMGQTAASQVGNSGLNYANMMGNAYGDIGNANAAGRIGSSNAWVGGINNAINSWWG